MEPKTSRLYFIDAMRAWAILMMLQGHFVDGLLDNFFRDPENNVYSFWLYFRGITAPVFFTVSGFIFTYLLIRVPQYGFDNPRIKKGIRRGVQLLIIGYLLRLNLFGLFEGKLYDSFFLVDVLHCIGISILTIIGIFLIAAHKKKWLFPSLLLGITIGLFLFEPIYKTWTFPILPDALANYFTKNNGSVFTVIPWVGYTAFGAFLSILFTRFKSFPNLYPRAISIAAIMGLGLIFMSSPFLITLYESTGIEVFKSVALNNYLFIRLGDVLVVFAIFMMLRHYLTDRTVIRIGQNTLSIYVIHFILLYGSFTGLGMYQFFNHSLSPVIAISGAVFFMIVCSYAALKYEDHEVAIKKQLTFLRQNVMYGIEVLISTLQKLLKASLVRLVRIFSVSKG